MQGLRLIHLHATTALSTGLIHTNFSTSICQFESHTGWEITRHELSFAVRHLQVWLVCRGPLTCSVLLGYLDPGNSYQLDSPGSNIKVYISIYIYIFNQAVRHDFTTMHAVVSTDSARLLNPLSLGVGSALPLGEQKKNVSGPFFPGPSCSAVHWPSTVVSQATSTSTFPIQSLFILCLFFRQRTLSVVCAFALDSALWYSVSLN